MSADPGDRAASFLRAQLAKTILQEPELNSFFGEKSGARIADIGCGRGYWLEYFASWNRRSDTLYGIERDWKRVGSSRMRLRRVNIVAGDARDLPWADASFDLLSQFVVFTSVLNKADRLRIASEMLRVLKPQGRILWYDFFAPNPYNRLTRAVRRAEIATLFPDCHIKLRRVTLAPPLARFSLRISRKLAEALDRMPLLCTHYLAVVKRSLEEK